jgi:hypothetical protein
VDQVWTYCNQSSGVMQPVAVKVPDFCADHRLRFAAHAITQKAGFLLMSKMSTSDLKAMLAADKTDALAAISAARHG